MEIDLLPTVEVLRVINREDSSVPDAVEKVIAEIACAVDRIVDAFGKGGVSSIWVQAPADGWGFWTPRNVPRHSASLLIWLWG